MKDQFAGVCINTWIKYFYRISMCLILASILSDIAWLVHPGDKWIVLVMINIITPFFVLIYLCLLFRRYRSKQILKQKMADKKHADIVNTGTFSNN